MQVKSTVKLNMARINELSQAAERALEQTAEALHDEVQQAGVVPRRDGALQGESFFVDCSQSQSGKVALIHDEPYARRLYYHPEYNFHKGPWEEKWTDKDGKNHHVKHDGNPNAKGKWLDDWLPGGGEADFAPNAFKRFYKKESGV